MNALWRPVSTCGPGCLPRGGPAGLPRRAARLAGAGLVVALGSVPALIILPVTAVLAPALLAGWSGAPRVGPAALGLRAAVVRWWARAVLAALGVRLSVAGSWPGSGATARPATAPGTLLVANHVSWLDVVALLAAAPSAMLVAKREVRRWPAIGVLAAAAGTLFLDRRRPRSLTGAVARVAGALRSGAVVAGFPEGTTWCGVSGGPFRPALFQAALDARVPVVPVAISYRADGVPTSAAAFVGAETLWRSVRRVAAAYRLSVRVEFTAALHPAPGTDRRALARVAETAVRAAVPTGGPWRPRPGAVTAAQGIPPEGLDLAA